jgi:hypothetical protein
MVGAYARYTPGRTTKIGPRPPKQRKNRGFPKNAVPGALEPSFRAADALSKRVLDRRGPPRRIAGMPSKRLPEIVKKILDSYEKVGGLNNTDGHNLPSKRSLDALCGQLLQFLFPGFHDERPIHKNELAEMTELRLQELAERQEPEPARGGWRRRPRARGDDGFFGCVAGNPGVVAHRYRGGV